MGPEKVENFNSLTAKPRSREDRFKIGIKNFDYKIYIKAKKYELGENKECLLRNLLILFSFCWPIFLFLY